jgi:hypothetical protein
MPACRTRLCLTLTANLVLCASAAAQMRVATVSPTVTADQLESPQPSSPLPSLHNVAPPEPDIPTKPRAPVANEPRGNPLWGISLNSLSVTRERPLFTRSRRPPTPAVAHVEPARPFVVPPPA